MVFLLNMRQLMHHHIFDRAAVIQHKPPRKAYSVLRVAASEPRFGRRYFYVACLDAHQPAVIVGKLRQQTRRFGLAFRLARFKRVHKLYSLAAFSYKICVLFYKTIYHAKRCKIGGANLRHAVSPHRQRYCFAA